MNFKDIGNTNDSKDYKDTLKKVFKERIYIELQRHKEPGEKAFENFLIENASFIEY